MVGGGGGYGRAVCGHYDIRANGGSAGLITGTINNIPQGTYTVKIGQAGSNSTTGHTGWSIGGNGQDTTLQFNNSISTIDLNAGGGKGGQAYNYKGKHHHIATANGAGGNASVVSPDKTTLNGTMVASVVVPPDIQHMAQVVIHHH